MALSDNSCSMFELPPLLPLLAHDHALSLRLLCCRASPTFVWNCCRQTARARRTCKIQSWLIGNCCCFNNIPVWIENLAIKTWFIRDSHEQLIFGQVILTEQLTLEPKTISNICGAAAKAGVSWSERFSGLCRCSCRYDAAEVSRWMSLCQSLSFEVPDNELLLYISFSRVELTSDKVRIHRWCLRGLRLYPSQINFHSSRNLSISQQGVNWLVDSLCGKFSLDFAWF